MQNLTLAEALELVCVYAEVEPAKFEKAALRWHSRYVTEAKRSLLQAQIALAALVELRVSSDAARKMLLELTSRSPAAVLTACGAVAVVGADASASPGAQPPALPSSCSDTSPCQLAAGTYRMGFSTVVEGLRLTLPRGWSAAENSGGELKLVVPGHPNEWLFIWLDLVAVKSTGKGAGTILPAVGRTPTKLLGWLTHHPDFAVVSRPRPSSLVRGVPMTTLAVGVSPRRTSAIRDARRIRDAPRPSSIRSTGHQTISMRSEPRKKCAFT